MLFIQHVLICGDLSSTSLREFFSELFHEDHDIRNLHAVVLQPEPPSYEIMNILKVLFPIANCSAFLNTIKFWLFNSQDTQFSMAITFLEGDPLNEKDLARAKVDEAKVRAQ